MTLKIALVGNTVTEEALADVIHHQTPGVQVHAYPTLPNAALARAVDENVPLYRVTAEGKTEPKPDEVHRLLSGYAAVHVSGQGQLDVVEAPLAAAGARYVGPTSRELVYETDKTKIFEVFPPETGVLPSTRILETADLPALRDAIAGLGGHVAAKFVGDYTRHFKGSAAGRTRVVRLGEAAELQEFARHSVEDSGQLLLQQFVEGQQFSYTCLVDANHTIFRLGENVCYKHRFEGETGPMCEGTGGVSVGNTVPGLVGPADVEWIAASIVKPFCEHVARVLGRSPRTFLNVDLIKTADGRIYLLEINTRSPGGNTMSNLVSGLDVPVAELLQATQEDRLAEVRPAFKRGASIAVAAFPTVFPDPVPGDWKPPTLVIPKVPDDSPVRVYTGWVDVLDERADAVAVEAKLYSTLIVSVHAPTVGAARGAAYEWLARVIPETTPDGFDYRRDIGVELDGAAGPVPGAAA